MIKLVTLFNLAEGSDVAAFEKHYREVHVPLASALPGLQKYTRGLVRPSRRKQTPYYRVAELYFADEEALKLALASPQAQAVNNDTAFFSRAKDMVQFICSEEEIPLR